MYPDRYYSLAFAFRKEKLWKHLYDTELFAVSLPNGEIGYCSVMGSLGEHLALALYAGSKGLDSFRFLMESDRESMNFLKAQEVMFSQDCLQCSFGGKDELTPQELSEARSFASAHGFAIRGANAFPQLACYRPSCCPCPITKQEDLELICTALEAALAVGEKLKDTDKSLLGFREGPAYDRAVPLLTPSEEGFRWSLHPLPPKQPASYPEAVLGDELFIARLKKAKRSRHTWVCDLVMIPQPFAGDELCSMRFPYTLLTGIYETKAALPTEIVTDPKREAERMLRFLGNQMLEHGVPQEIQVIDERTYTLLKNLAEPLAIRLALQSGNKFLDELEEFLLAYFDAPEPDMADDEADYLADLLMSNDAMAASPEELLELLGLHAEQGHPAGNMTGQTPEKEK